MFEIVWENKQKRVASAARFCFPFFNGDELLLFAPQTAVLSPAVTFPSRNPRPLPRLLSQLPLAFPDGDTIELDNSFFA